MKKSKDYERDWNRKVRIMSERVKKSKDYEQEGSRKVKIMSEGGQEELGL